MGSMINFDENYVSHANEKKEDASDLIEYMHSMEWKNKLMNE